MRHHQEPAPWPRRWCALVLLLASCSTPTATIAPEPSLVAPSATATATAQPTATATVTPEPAPRLPAYTLNTLIDYDARAVTVDETIVYPNDSGRQLTALVLAVVPNLWQGGFSLQSLSVDGAPVTDFSLDGQRLEIRLSNTVMEEATTIVSIQFELALPFIPPDVDPNVSRPRIFGYSGAQLNLTNWYPYIVPQVEGNWLLHDPWYYGEHLVYEAANFEVNLQFSDPTRAPVVAASGFPEQADGFTRYTLQGGRTFAISASQDYQVSTMEVGDVIVSSYSFPYFQGEAQAALRASAQALQLYSERFGAYPHRTLAVVMGDFRDGMEFSALFYLSKDFYNLYDEAAPHNYLVSVAAHETAHQWWFEQIGNDQAMQPWLDEALCTYSERLYYEIYMPDRLGWWWSYRIDFFSPQGFVDVPIYSSQGFRSYTNAVYFQGAHFLEALRQRMGDQAFFSFLQDYLALQRGTIATARDFFAILRLHTSADHSDLFRQYFQNSY